MMADSDDSLRRDAVVQIVNCPATVVRNAPEGEVLREVVLHEIAKEIE